MLSIVSSGANVIYIPILIKSFDDIFIEIVEKYVDFKTVGYFYYYYYSEETGTKTTMSLHQCSI